MGLSAGSAVILNALERLPEGVQVKNVVFFQPSVSASHDLTPALAHISGKLYATCSRRDAILSTLGVNADGQSGAPAGRSGFRIASGLTAKQRRLYTKVVNLPWRKQYRQVRLARWARDVDESQVRQAHHRPAHHGTVEAVATPRRTRPFSRYRVRCRRFKQPLRNGTTEMGRHANGPVIARAKLVRV